MGRKKTIVEMLAYVLTLGAVDPGRVEPVENPVERQERLHRERWERLRVEERKARKKKRKKKRGY